MQLCEKQIVALADEIEAAAPPLFTSGLSGAGIAELFDTVIYTAAMRGVFASQQATEKKANLLVQVGSSSAGRGAGGGGCFGWGRGVDLPAAAVTASDPEWWVDGATSPPPGGGERGPVEAAAPAAESPFPTTRPRKRRGALPAISSRTELEPW